MTRATISVETWGDKFVVVAQFDGLVEVTPVKFSTMREAVEEMAKIAAREKMRYELGMRGPFGD